jgi:predicted aldo/keto reductase-like oxidoreductase
MYYGGSEIITGKALEGRYHERIVLTTKSSSADLEKYLDGIYLMHNISLP